MIGCFLPQAGSPAKLTLTHEDRDAIPKELNTSAGACRREDALPKPPRAGTCTPKVCYRPPPLSDSIIATIGRNIAITIVPTMTPMPTTMIGSSRDMADFTATSTSSS